MTMTSIEYDQILERLRSVTPDTTEYPSKTDEQLVMVVSLGARLIAQAILDSSHELELTVQTGLGDLVP